MLDALIGNTDRHHENWGILVEHTQRGMLGTIAPSFDHASSLGRELQDDTSGKCRLRILGENRIGRYAEHAPGAIYWQESDKRAISPLELVRRASRLHPDLFRRAFTLLDKLDQGGLQEILGRIPAGWMSDIARRFALELTCYNLGQLREMAS